MGKSFRVVHIIAGLPSDGAEMMLYKLLSRMNRKRFNSVVVSLMDRGTLGDRIEALGIPVYTIGMKPGRPTIASIWRIISTIRNIKPGLIQGWLSHGNLAAQLVSAFVPGRVPVLWNVRHSALPRSDTKIGTLLIIKLLAYLSRLPAKIIYNCKIGADDHQQIGYDIEKTIIIPNGFDTNLFAPSVEARLSVRSELNLAENTFFIGRLGRFHPMKDHLTFLQAAAFLLKVYPEVHFLLAGSGIDGNNQVLHQFIKQLNIGEKIHLLGERQDISRIAAALDIATSSSAYGEGFPNIIGEAMSCGVPCVVTDVSDSAWIVGDTGRVVPPRDPKALCAAWVDLIEIGSSARVELGARARQRIQTELSLEKIVYQYEKLYEEQLYGI
ncbi:glycosyltransferase [Funiculus sociatus GB2-A5]|uniref:Glycosyltransferase n=1 Tax=Funiculus sociatus GB2-A5 TaxID=2933946 RepID=A0ABV0JQL6_9CYAN|nr:MULTISPECIES: glycosyltransferase [unclassified Trichocoleus]MBD1906690.1 glycosyltransferase [Trichocoleus sp. FACHB-832]MBD2063127.1 glycosyltransferase [Trichocoleus sp. FACHB-6]